jgi:hypothetical protein
MSVHTKHSPTSWHFLHRPIRGIHCCLAGGLAWNGEQMQAVYRNRSTQRIFPSSSL